MLLRIQHTYDDTEIQREVTCTHRQRTIDTIRVMGTESKSTRWRWILHIHIKEGHTERGIMHRGRSSKQKRARRRHDKAEVLNGKDGMSKGSIKEQGGQEICTTYDGEEQE